MLYNGEGVRQERSGWRDQEISARHRAWGFNCPAVDLDFLVVEYNIGRPVGLVEYKHYKAQSPDLRHPTYRALTALADGWREPLPFLLCYYWPKTWSFKAYPVNATAQSSFRWAEELSEYEYVRRLYRLRRLTLAREIEGKLNLVCVLPSEEEIRGPQLELAMPLA